MGPAGFPETLVETTIPRCVLPQNRSDLKVVNVVKEILEFFMFEFLCIITLYYIKNQQDATLAILFISHCKDHSTCFGRFLRPSSGVLKTVVTATGACHGSG